MVIRALHLIAVIAGEIIMNIQALGQIITKVSISQEILKKTGIMKIVDMSEEAILKAAKIITKTKIKE